MTRMLLLATFSLAATTLFSLGNGNFEFMGVSNQNSIQSSGFSASSPAGR